MKAANSARNPQRIFRARETIDESPRDCTSSDDALRDEIPELIKKWKYDPAEEKIRKLEFELASLKQQYTASAKEHKGESQSNDELVKNILSKEKLTHLLKAVSSSAHEQILSEESFAEMFWARTPCKAFVISIDIRRSTTLMLKSREPQLFASFITSLCSTLSDIVKDAYGVFDKFTGDGILAFFPDFYTGTDAAYYTLEAAEKCHATFTHHYQTHRHCFISVLKDVGLGIGIDYGDVNLMDFEGGLTVVGSPVVYACRMAGAPAGLTLLNQPAYEAFDSKLKGVCQIAEETIDIKGEGMTLAYSVTKMSKPYTPKQPPWLRHHKQKKHERKTTN